MPRSVGSPLATAVAATLAAILAIAAGGCSDEQAGAKPDDVHSPPPTTAKPTPAAHFKPDRPAGFSPCDLLSARDVVKLAHLERGDLLFSWQLARYGSPGVDTCRIGERSIAACAGCDFGYVEVGVYTGRPRRTFGDLTSELTGVDRPPVGDRAVLSRSAPGAYTMWVKQDDTIVFLYVQQAGSEPLMSREVVRLARRAVANLPDDAGEQVDRAEALPKACDALDRAAIETVLGGPVVLARGNVSKAGINCDYQADNPVRRYRDSPVPKQLGLHVDIRTVRDGAEFLDGLVAGEYGTPAEEVEGLGERAVIRTAEDELQVLIDDTTLLTIEGFLAYGPRERAPRAALIDLAESALTMV